MKDASASNRRSEEDGLPSDASGCPPGGPRKPPSRDPNARRRGPAGPLDIDEDGLEALARPAPTPSGKMRHG